MTQKIINKIQEVDWAAAAKRTADGVNQVKLLGGERPYNELINGLVPRMVARAIAASKGTHYGENDKRGWRVLTPSNSVQVAHRGKADFAPHDIFYMSEGTKRETARVFKRAKKLLLPGWFGSKPPAPFEGPYFN